MSAHSESLDNRKRKILKAVVHEHVETAEPVASESLVQHYDFGVRSATIRNEMAEMADMGYLRQPHTSSGRVPSDLGYRFYVDQLMDAPHLPMSDAVKAKESLASAAVEFDRAISQTCRILTGLTRYTSIATQIVGKETIIRHISLSRITGRKLLLVVVLSDGRVEHRIVDPGISVQDRDVIQVSNLLSSHFCTASIGAVLSADDIDIPQPVSQSAGTIYSRAKYVLKNLAESLSFSDTSVHIEGTNYILSQPEFQDVLRLTSILSALEERTRLYQLLSRLVLGPDVTVIVGAENPYNEMQDTSFVAASYKIGDKVVGTIGVIGPTRMNYRRAVAAVEVMARNLSNLLTDLSLS
ncbi:MAG: heat-inducible transcriptional repressor HrcA [Armatimonadota bacterium]